MVSGLLAMVVFGAYLLLFAVVSEMRHSVKGTDRPEAALASVERIEDIISDLETGVIGFAITHDPAALRPWNTERDDLRAAETRLERLAASTGQRRSGEARRIVEDSETYLRRYLGPLVDGLQRNADSSRVLGMIGGMERQITVLQSEIDRFESDEHGLVEHYEDRTGAYTHRAKIITIAGASWAVLMILFCSAYLARTVLRPVRRTLHMADDIASGGLGVRVPETSPDELGALERSVNAMAAALRAGRKSLDRVAEEQAALRRIATLIGYGSAPAQVFNAIAGELGRLQRADYAVVNRFEPGRVVTAVGHWTAPGVPDIMPPLGGRWKIDGESAAAQIMRTARPARMTMRDDNAGRVGAWTRAHGIHHVVGSPIMMEGRLWGMMAVLSLTPEPSPEDTERHLREFADLLVTAVANAENRNQLLCSYTRILAACDKAHFRIEDELRDVVQQRLLTLQRELRSTNLRVPEDREMYDPCSRTSATGCPTSWTTCGRSAVGWARRRRPPAVSGSPSRPSPGARPYRSTSTCGSDGACPATSSSPSTTRCRRRSPTSAGTPARRRSGSTSAWSAASCG